MSDNWLANGWQLVRCNSTKNKAKYVKELPKLICTLVVLDFSAISIAYMVYKVDRFQ